MKDLTNGELKRQLEYAKSIGDTSLQSCLDRLRVVEDKNDGIETSIFTDFAPRSFYFLRETKDKEFRGNGGIIFHGAHDRGGDGGAPSFSVSITPTVGWSIHT